jgi:hypothetical protein
VGARLGRRRGSGRWRLGASAECGNSRRTLDASADAAAVFGARRARQQSLNTRREHRARQQSSGTRRGAPDAAALGEVAAAAAVALALALALAATAAALGVVAVPVALAAWWRAPGLITSGEPGEQSQHAVVSGVDRRLGPVA